MRAAMCQWLGVGVFWFAVMAQPALANMRSITLSSEDKIPVSHWMFNSQQQVQGPQVVRQLAQLKKAERGGSSKTCMDLAKGLRQSASSLQAWLAVSELRCSYRWIQAPKNPLAPALAAVKWADQHSEWFLLGPQTTALRDAYAEVQLHLLKRQMSGQRTEAWRTVNRLLEVRDWLSPEQQSRLYRSAGEMAFIQQNLPVTIDYFQRSLNAKDSKELRKRLESAKRTYQETLGKKVDETAKAKSKRKVGIEASENELKIYERMQQALRSGDLVSAAEDGVELITEYPGSRRAKWAEDRILESYLGVAGKDDKRYKMLRDRLKSLMRKCDGARLYRWANNAYARGHYADALELAEASVKALGGHPDSTEALSLSAHSALQAGEYSAAISQFEQLAKEHSGTKASVEALFRLGLINYRQKDDSAASAYFEKILALPEPFNFDYSALYWLWRAQQRSKAENSQQYAQQLVEEYPLTYYGLRARAELNDGKLNWPKPEKSEPVKLDWWLTQNESQAWERLQLLLRAGWLIEAREELRQLPEPRTPEEKLLKSRYWAASMNHYAAIEMINQAWDDDPSLQRRPFLSWAYPMDFSGLIEKEAEREGLSPHLVRAVIRQESSFRPDAVSPAQAAGLMQLVPPTAKEVANWVGHKKKLKIPDDLFEPEINIRFGTHYLRRMVRAFKGNVPLALAAYNAGIGRMRKWMAARPDLGDLEAQQTGAPESEIWIDELPWSETNFYVKAILRNFMIYQMLESDKEVPVTGAVWKVESEK